jgi:hypothetical protein
MALVALTRRSISNSIDHSIKLLPGETGNGYSDQICSDDAAEHVIVTLMTIHIGDEISSADLPQPPTTTEVIEI